MGVKPTNDIFADVEVIAYLSCTMVFTRATNGINYWYCIFFNAAQMELAKHILHSNSVPVLEHETRYNYAPQPALRVTCSALKKQSVGKAFVKRAMAIKYGEKVSESVVRNRIAVLTEKVK